MSHDIIDHTVPCVTADGLRLSLRRVRAARGAERQRAVVILQHGLGANGAIFDCPRRSLVRHLAARGFDCYVPELRGAGRSERPKRSFGLDEYLELDVPAIVQAVRSASGVERVRWVGHSMGGILAMFYALEHGDQPIERLVAIGSALDYSPGRSTFRELRRARWLAGGWLRTLPFGRLAQLNALVCGYGPLFPAEKMNFWRGNVEPEVARHVLLRGCAPIPMRLLDDLDTTFSFAGFSRADGRIAYLPRTKHFRTPTCLIGGSVDPQCTKLALDATARLLSGAPELEVAHFGRRHGHGDEYGHMDLVVGRHASEEVWPTITRWLDGPGNPAAREGMANAS